jgi:dTDP-4-amino-4,6-dideoxygalactose transaminase
MTPGCVTLPFPARPKYGDAEIAAVAELMRTGRLSEVDRGPAVTALEDAFARLTGTTRALSFGSGTASLHAALHAAGASPDAGVAMSPMTWISAITAAFQAGSYPLFADLAAHSPNLDPPHIDTAQTSAVLVTHAWGIPAPVEELTSLPVPVIEDCSHAHGATYRGRPVGSWGAAGCFSLQESKTVSGGEGGVLTTSDDLLYQRAMTVGHHPYRLAAELTAPELRPLTEAAASYKYRMPAVSAVIAREQLRELPDRMQACERNLAHLASMLSDASVPLHPFRLPAHSARGWYGTPFTLAEPVGDAAALTGALKAAHVPVRALYPDWLAMPLLQEPALIERYWPHMRGRWKAPDPHSFRRYQQFRAQTIILKIPDTPAPDYMSQVASALGTVIRTHHLANRGTR